MFKQVSNSSGSFGVLKLYCLLKHAREAKSLKREGEKVLGKKLLQTELLKVLSILCTMFCINWYYNNIICKVIKGTF